MRIKEGDEWKVAFVTSKGFFKPTIMFFGLTNLPATFQAIINELLRDLINMGKFRSFIDDIIVGTEIEEEYNNLVAEILRRLNKNDLYIKLEKCKWKVREVDFLEIVLGLESIKMEEMKVKAILN